MTNSDVWARLAAPLPKSAILQRKGAGGRMLDYIDRPVVWERLDSVAPGEWEFSCEVLGASGNGDGEPYAVKGSLTVFAVTREDIGQGKDMKEAATDAFKRCAVQFGIGRQLYAKGNVGVPHAAAARSAPSGGGTLPSPAPASAPLMPFGKNRGKPLSAIPTEALEAALAWVEQKGLPEKYEGFVENAVNELEQRRIAAA